MKKINVDVSDYKNERVPVTGYVFSYKNLGEFVVHPCLANNRLWVVSDYLTGYAITRDPFRYQWQAVRVAKWILDTKSKKYVEKCRRAAAERSAR